RIRRECAVGWSHFSLIQGGALWRNHVRRMAVVGELDRGHGDIVLESLATLAELLGTSPIPIPNWTTTELPSRARWIYRERKVGKGL
ncbi:hypothetical protein, partial [Nocardia cyriacigeorgica]|uniref:hypothetical protein n=1 Tax=Nocardia cyriacigeorgica TaxID=135487 RepID=UPI001BB24D21